MPKDANITDAVPSEKQRSEPVRFSKANLLTVRRFEDRRDLLTALLDDGKQYSVQEAEDIMNGFLRKVVD